MSDPVAHAKKYINVQKRKNKVNEQPTGWFAVLQKEAGSFLTGENTSTWALFAEIVIGAVPIAGQLIDARDIIKAVLNLKNKPSDSTLWFLLIAALIGLIPVFGDAVKSAIKAIKIGGKSPADLFAFIRKFGKGNAEEALRKALDVSKLKGLLNSILTPKFLNSLSKSNKQKLIQIQKDFDRFAQQIVNEINGWSKMTPATASSNSVGVGRTAGNKPSTALASTNRNASGEAVSHNSSITSTVARKDPPRDEKGRYTYDPNKPRTNLTRPSIRANTERKIRERYKFTDDGKAIDKITGEVIEPPLHYGHQYGWENRRLIEASEELGMSQKQLNDYVNSKPNLFKIENGPDNISHRDEKPGRGELDDITKDMRRFLENK